MKEKCYSRAEYSKCIGTTHVVISDIHSIHSNQRMLEKPSIKAISLYLKAFLIKVTSNGKSNSINQYFSKCIPS